MLKTIKLKFNTNKVMVFSFAIMFIIILIFNNYKTYQKLKYVKNVNSTLSKKVTEGTNLQNNTLQHISELEKEVQYAKSSSIVVFTAEDLKQNIISNYPNISSKNKIIIMNTILEVSDKYNFNPLILYSLIHTESSMRYWIEHKRVLININNKKKYIRAVGLGGVVWEWWSKQLKKEGIAEVRSDLFDPATNIRAIGYIYNSFYNMRKLKKASTQDESAMIRYFGGGYKSYFEKIDRKVAELISQKLYR